MTALQITWFFLVGLLLTVFAILDGFDLGVGLWYLRAKGDGERRSLLRAIGPVWDGNEVWLLTGAGALFAAFPPVYAAVFSGFYLAFVLLILALVARAVSIEFRNKEESAIWRASWDAVFSVSSALAGLLLGVAFGNVLGGVRLDESGNYAGSFQDLLNPYALLTGALGLSMLAFHGANFIAWRSGGDLKSRAGRWAWRSGFVYFALFAATSIATIAAKPHLVENYRTSPVLFAIPLLAAVFIAGAAYAGRLGRRKTAFLGSSLSIAAMMSTAGAALFPRLVPALGDPELSLTAANSSSSELALGTMLAIAGVGMPLVLGYTFWVYKAFWGIGNADKVEEHY